MTSECQSVQQFVIPRKGGNGQQGAQSSRLLDDVPLTSEDFRSQYWPIFCKHLSVHQKERNLSVTHCMAIRNNTLEEKFKEFQKKLEDRGDPSEVSYCFYRLAGPLRETELIAQHGLFTGNTFIGDLGETSKGVHLNESPDLVTPAKFIENTRLRIMAFKVLKGRSNVVGLSSFTLEPTPGFASHVARPPTTADSLSRHEVFRYNQVYLYEEYEPGIYSNVPANVLPFAVFTVDFAPNATTSFKYMPTTLWNGVLKIGERRYADMTLQSCGGILIKPPFFSSGRVFEITDLVLWRACLDYPPIVDLLSLQMIGKLSTKKEVLLNGAKRLATYFTLRPQYDNPQFASLHESMRVRCVAGLSVLASGATVLVIPNGEFASLLALPCREGPVFHCFHFSRTLGDSLLTGTFEPFTPEENDDFNRLPNVGERVNGHDVDVKNIIEQLASGCVQKEPCDEVMRNSPGNNPAKDLPRHPDATPENLSPADMEIVSSDEEEASVTTNVPPNRSKKQVVSSSKILPRESKKSDASNETVPRSSTTLENVKAVTRVTYHRSRDPRQRPRTGATALPLPRVGMLPTPDFSRTSASNLKDMTNEGRPTDVEKKTQQKGEVMDEQRSYSPSQAISDEALSAGPSSPIDQSSSSAAVNEGSILKLEIPTITLDDKGDVLSVTNESPASPPIEKNVYVAQAPKIISGSDLRPLCGQPLHTSSHTYKAPEISLFANAPIPAISNFNLSSAGLQKLSEMGVRRGTAPITKTQSGNTAEGRASPWSTMKTDQSNGRAVPTTSEEKSSADGNEGSIGANQNDESKTSSGAQTAETNKPIKEPDVSGPSRWDADSVITTASTDVDYRTFLPQRSVSCAPVQVHRGMEPTPAAVLGDTLTGAILSASDKDDRTLSPFVGQGSEVATSSNLKPPCLLEVVPSPVTADSNEVDRRPPIPHQSTTNQVRGGGRPGRPIPLNTIRSRQSGLLGERPPCFPPPVPMSGLRPIVPRSDFVRPPIPVFMPRPTFENITPGNFGFFNRPTPSTVSHSAPSYSAARGLDMPPDFPRGLSRKGIILPDGRIFIQALLHPGRLRSLLERLSWWRQKWNIIWWLKVHSHVLKAVNRNSETMDAESDALVKYSSYSRLLGEFTTKGSVELLKAHECDDEIDAGIECNYLECVAKMAKESGNNCSVIFVTGIASNAEMVRRYGSAGVEVCTFQQLMEKFGV